MSLEQLNLLLRVCGRKDAEEGGKEGREGGRRMGRERMNEGKYWVGFSDPEGQKSISCLPECYKQTAECPIPLVVFIKGGPKI